MQWCQDNKFLVIMYFMMELKNKSYHIECFKVDTLY